MRAVRLVAPQRVELTTIPIPEIGPADVLLRVAAAGICHSDLHVSQSSEPLFRRPVTLGHEIAGHVEGVGAAVSGWVDGDPAIVHLCWSCGVCRACSAGEDNVCEAVGRRAQPRTPGLGPDGGMAEFVRVPARFLVRADGLDLVTAAPLADAGMTPYHAIRNSLPVLFPGATAVVIGIGGLGHVAVQILRAVTAVRVIAVDVAADKLALATSLGANVALTAGAGTADEILNLTGGRGAEAIFDFVGNAATTRTSALSVAPNGIYQLAGLGGGRVDITAVSRDGTAWPWGAAVRTSYAGTRSDLIECLSLARAGRIALEVERFPLDDALDAFGRLDQGAVRGRAVLIP